MQHFTPALILLLSLLCLGKACYTDDGSLVNVGELTTVCLILSPLAWGVQPTHAAAKFLSMRTELVADEFSTIVLTEAWTGLRYVNDTAMRQLNINDTQAGNGLGVSLGSLGVPSYQKSYRRVDSAVSVSNPSPHFTVSTVTFPLLMAVIRVEDGKVKEIIWDDSCDWCDASRCAPNTYTFSGALKDIGGSSCFVPDHLCVTDVNGGEVSDLCKPKIYVTWTGTDSKGFHFLSAAKRISQLSGTQLKYVILGRDGV